jgi:hypothetical protein
MQRTARRPKQGRRQRGNSSQFHGRSNLERKRLAIRTNQGTVMACIAMRNKAQIQQHFRHTLLSPG